MRPYFNEPGYMTTVDRAYCLCWECEGHSRSLSSEPARDCRTTRCLEIGFKANRIMYSSDTCKSAWRFAHGHESEFDSLRTPSGLSPG